MRADLRTYILLNRVKTKLGYFFECKSLVLIEEAAKTFIDPHFKWQLLYSAVLELETECISYLLNYSQASSWLSMTSNYPHYAIYLHHHIHKPLKPSKDLHIYPVDQRTSTFIQWVNRLPQSFMTSIHLYNHLQTSKSIHDIHRPLQLSM